jgi:hypothetical protein
MFEYIIMIRIPFEAGDDPDARKRAQDLLKYDVSINVPEATMKLQRLEKGKAPEGIALFT